MRLLSDVQLTLVYWIELQWSENLSTYELTCELPFHCLACSCHLEVLMVISIDSLLIKQLRKLLNVILVISLFTWQDVWRDNSILENMSSWHLYQCVFWPISQHLPFFEEWMFVECLYCPTGTRWSFLWKPIEL